MIAGVTVFMKFKPRYWSDWFWIDEVIIVPFRVGIEWKSAIDAVVGGNFAGVDEVRRGIDAVVLGELYFVFLVFFFELVVRAEG